MLDLNQLIKSTFKLNGYNLNIETQKYLNEVLTAEIENEQYENFLDKLIEDLSKKNLESGNSLTKPVIEDLVKDLTQNKNAKEKRNDLFHLIDCFDVPKSYYCEHSKKLIKATSKDHANNKRSTIATASAKVDMFLQRYKIIYQRTLRHELFSPCSISESASSTNGKKKFQLKPIEFLLSSVHELEDIIVLGMIVQLKENKFFLEDPTGNLPLNLAEAKYHSGDRKSVV